MGRTIPALTLYEQIDSRDPATYPAKTRRLLGRNKAQSTIALLLKGDDIEAKHKTAYIRAIRAAADYDNAWCVVSGDDDQHYWAGLIEELDHYLAEASWHGR